MPKTPSKPAAPKKQKRKAKPPSKSGESRAAEDALLAELDQGPLDA
jgi:hypothetical protein